MQYWSSSLNQAKHALISDTVTALLPQVIQCRMYLIILAISVLCNIKYGSYLGSA